MAQFKRTVEIPRKQDSPTIAKKIVRVKKPRRRFLEVEVWRKEFGPVSERAIYDIYAQKFNVELYNMKKYSFQHCVNALRKLENPDYIAPNYGTDE